MLFGGWGERSGLGSWVHNWVSILVTEFLFYINFGRSLEMTTINNCKVSRLEMGTLSFRNSAYFNIGQGHSEMAIAQVI
jgi:hypothetical protein